MFVRVQGNDKFNFKMKYYVNIVMEYSNAEDFSWYAEREIAFSKNS